MNELTVKDEAVQLHTKIQGYVHQCQESIYQIGKLMAEMKERKLYKQLGYEEFEDYTEKEFALKHTQAGKFISIYKKFGSDYIKENQNLGVSKLYLLSQLSEDDREVIEAHAVDSSVSELQEQIRALKEEKEKMQLSFFELEKENKELKERPIDVAVQEPEDNSEEIENIKAGYEAKLKNLQNKLEEAQSDNKKASERITKLEEDAEQYGIIAEAQEKQKIKIKEDYDAEVAKLKADYEEKIKEANQKVEEANQKIEESTHVDGTDNETIFKSLIKGFIGMLNQCTQFIEELQDEEEQKVYKQKFIDVLDKIKGRIE